MCVNDIVWACKWFGCLSHVIHPKNKILGIVKIEKKNTEGEIKIRGRLERNTCEELGKTRNIHILLHIFCDFDSSNFASIHDNLRAKFLVDLDASISPEMQMQIYIYEFTNRSHLIGSNYGGIPFVFWRLIINFPNLEVESLTHLRVIIEWRVHCSYQPGSMVQ